MSDMFEVRDRVAIVTGASSGLGARFARVLLDAGAHVVVAARRADRIAAFPEEFGAERCLAVPTDVADEASVERLVAAAVERFGSVDILVNNAGTTNVAPAVDETAEVFTRVLGVNVVGVFSCCRAAGRVMLGQEKGGTIVNVASTLGFVGIGRIPQAAYAASKGAVVNLTRELAAQWSRKGIRVNAIAPGWFPSEMTAPLFNDESGLRYIERTVPMGRGGRDDELDGALLFLASDASSYVTGQSILVDGGWSIV